MIIKSFRFLFEPRDIWLGLFWREDPSGTDRALARGDLDSTCWVIYLCLIPCFPLRIEFKVRRRVYTSGTRWCLWRWTDVDWQGQLYLRRLHLFQTPGGALMLHWIKTPDPHPDPHDHPVSFLSITLRGAYYEEWRGEEYDDPAPRWIRNRFRFRRATDIHKITDAEPGTLTLVFAGPVVRCWGFHTARGFIPWKTYREAHAR
jgi:hypothetical protein